MKLLNMQIGVILFRDKFPQYLVTYILIYQLAAVIVTMVSCSH
jgi:hypothetical protein